MIKVRIHIRHVDSCKVGFEIVFTIGYFKLDANFSLY